MKNQNDEVLIKERTEAQQQAKEREEAKKGRTQKQSVSYALKAIGGHVKTLVDNNLLEEEDTKTINGLVEKAVKAYMMQEYGLKLGF